MRMLLLKGLRAGELFVGEVFARLAAVHGKVAARLLFHAQWSYRTPEWFDHRLHLLDPELWFTDYWTASADNVLRVLPLRGRLLNMCSGDGFYDYWFYRRRASEIMCVEFNREAFDLAVRHHADARIRYVFADVLTCELPERHFDVVSIRGAIEHFKPADQIRLFKKCFEALKPDGWFCGDTPAKKTDGIRQLPSHEHEWSDEQEMRRALGEVFTSMETWSMISENRTTLFWRCRKE